jgi:hypothetical protein
MLQFVRIFTMSYVFTGQVEASQAVLGWLNNPNKKSIDMMEVEGIALDPSAIITRFRHSAVTVPKDRVVAVDLMTPELARTIQVGERRESVVVYAGRYVFEGVVHPPGTMPVNNLLDVIGSTYLPMSLAKLHPMTSTRALPTDFSPLLIFSRDYVDFFHASARRANEW